jgi:hypothetical protein
MIADSTGSWWKERERERERDTSKICSLALSQVLSQDRDHSRKMISVFSPVSPGRDFGSRRPISQRKTLVSQRSCITPDERQRNKHFQGATRATALGDADALEMLVRL